MQGLGSAQLEGASQWRLRPGAPAGLLGPKWAGEVLAKFPLILRGSLPVPTDPLPVGRGSQCALGTPLLGAHLPAWEPLPSPSHPSGHWSHLTSSFPLPLPPTPPGPTQMEGASEGGGSALGTQQPPWGLSGWGKRWPCSLPIL